MVWYVADDGGIDFDLVHEESVTYDSESPTKWARKVSYSPEKRGLQKSRSDDDDVFMEGT